MKRTQTGFTLIELMIVIAILGILAAIAIPAYQDYSVRTKISEGIVAAAPAKLAVSEYRQSENAYPTNRTQAGASDIISDYVTGMTIIGNGVIYVDINEAATGASNVSPSCGTLYIRLIPNDATGATDWTCEASPDQTTTGVFPAGSSCPRLVPSSCR